MKTNKIQNLGWVLSLILVFFASYSTISASNFKGGDNVTIDSEVDGNLYLAAGRIDIKAPIKGDLICAGGEIFIQDKVSEDLTIVGGKLDILAPVGDDLRIAGGEIIISNLIRGDLIIAGGEVRITEDAIINGDIRMAAGELTMQGIVRGTADLAGGKINWSGTAEEGLIIKGGEVNFSGLVRGSTQLAAHHINIGSPAKFYGNVEYWTKEGSIDFGTSLMEGYEANYNEDLQFKKAELDWRYMGFGIFVFWVYRLLVAAVLIGLLIWMFHRFFYRHSEESTKNFASHMGYGFLYLFGVPIASLLSFITIIGIPVGMVIFTFYGISIALSSVITAVLVSYAWNAYYDKGWTKKQLFFGAMVSYMALKIIGMIPFIGSLASLLVVATAIGTLIYIWRESRKAVPQDLV